MSAYVLDTSVAAAWYLPEGHAVPARHWQRRMLDAEIEIVVPTLHFTEMANLLRNLVRRGHLSTDLAREIDEIHRQAPLQVADPPRETILETALRYEASAYDATFIALAEALSVPLITAERGATHWVSRLGSRAITIGAER